MYLLYINYTSCYIIYIIYIFIGTNARHIYICIPAVPSYSQFSGDRGHVLQSCDPFQGAALRVFWVSGRFVFGSQLVHQLPRGCFSFWTLWMTQKTNLLVIESDGRAAHPTPSSP